MREVKQFHYFFLKLGGGCIFEGDEKKKEKGKIYREGWYSRKSVNDLSATCHDLSVTCRRPVNIDPSRSTKGEGPNNFLKKAKIAVKIKKSYFWGKLILGTSFEMNIRNLSCSSHLDHTRSKKEKKT